MAIPIQKNMAMKTILSSIPGYRAHDYLVVLAPHADLWNRVMKVKEEFAEQYKCEQAKWGKPYVTLVSFTQHAMMEERILNNLRLVAMGFPPFKVELKNYGSFPSHTIYINVTSKIPVQNLVKQIRTSAQRVMKLDDENKPYFMLEPHLTIARKLQPWQYEKSWLEYSQKHFTGKFVADAMMLLRRSAGEFKYHLVEKFAFQNLPVATKQGELFG